MEHFCLSILLTHLPGDERGENNFFFFLPVTIAFPSLLKERERLQTQLNVGKMIESGKRKEENVTWLCPPFQQEAKSRTDSVPQENLVTV